jgi:hypothetical protein
MYMKSTDVLTFSGITENPVEASKFIALSKLKAGLFTDLNKFLATLIPNNTVMNMTNEVKQNAPHPCPASAFERRITAKRIGTVVNIKMKVSDAGCFFILASIAAHPA